MEKRYRVVESLHWRNVQTGLTASIYGAAPWTSDADRAHWRRESCGWTIADDVRGTVGIGRVPFGTRDEAQALADTWNAKIATKAQTT